MNALDDWLKKHKRKRYAFAAEVGISPAYMTQLCAGTCWPGREVAIRLRAATNGDITPNDFLPPFEPKPVMEAAE